MNIKIAEYAVGAIKNIVSLSEKAIEAGSPETFANSIQKMTKSVDETYAQMRQMIMDDDTLDTDEKIKRLNEIAKSQQAAYERCEESIRGNRENAAKVAMEIFKGFLTCGISFLPAILSDVKKVFSDKEDVKNLEKLLDNKQEITDGKIE